MKRGLRQSMPNVPIPVADTSGRPPFSQAEPVGRIRETCSCGAQIEAPANDVCLHMVESWRDKHRHTPPPDRVDNPLPRKSGPDAHVTTGEIRESETQDVPFGFFPPVVEARQP